MIKGLVLTPPVLGRISIGRVVEVNGKRLPDKDDQFTLTTQIQGREGWLLHPYDDALRRAAQGGKLRTLPVRMLFNDPALNLRAEYSLFDRQTGRPLCVGNGETCRRRGEAGLQSFPCPSPEGCAFGQGGCKPYGRLNVRIGEEDALGSFIFRTTGYNSIRTLAARLRYFQAVSGDRLSCLKLDLRLRAKSTALSYRTPVYYVDLTVREGMTLEEAISEAIALDTQRRDGGFDQAALERAAHQGFANGAFEESGEEEPELIEEFFPESESESGAPPAKAPAPRPERASLKAKLEHKALELDPQTVKTLRSMAREVFDSPAKA